MERLNIFKQWNNTKWQNWALVILLALSLALHVATIMNPAEPLFDELHYVPDCERIISNEGTERVEHPPVGKLFIAAGMIIFGDNPVGYRAPAIILNTIMLFLFYDLLRRMGMKHKYAFIATMFLAFDNLAFIHGGMAMLDIYVEFFTILAFWLYIKGWWELAAVSVALAGLSKLSGVLSIAPIGLHWLITQCRQSIRQIPEGKNLTPLQGFAYKYGDIVRFFAAMFLAPISFILLMPVFDWMIWGHWINPIDQILNMGTMTKGIGFDAYIDEETGMFRAPIPSRPWEWILSPTGTFYFYGWLFNPEKYQLCVLGYWSDPQVTGMLNPTTWLMALASIPYGIYRWIKTKSSYVIFMMCWIIGTWALWIPLSIATDRSSFLFYFLPTVGAVCMAGAIGIEQFMEKAIKTERKKTRVCCTIFTLALVVGHMVSFCVLSPVRLWVSIPASIVIVLLSIDQLGFNTKLKLPYEPEIIVMNDENNILLIPEEEFDFPPEFDDDSDCVINTDK